MNLAGDLARRVGWPWVRPNQPEPAMVKDAAVYVDWLQLTALEHTARSVRWPPQTASSHSLLAGRHRSRVRGRGLDFIELRQYLPGDDTRAIDWRASARTGRTHLRVYAEERDRPTWLVVDQRISMFFARRGAMGSVVAAQAAAVWGWRALSGGDRIGGVVIADADMDDVAPQRGRRSMLRFLQLLTQRNQGLQADFAYKPAPEQLDAALALLARQAPRQGVIAVFSDFDGLGATTRQRLLALSRHNDLVLLPVWDDPATTTPDVQLVVSDGTLQLPINHANVGVRERLATVAKTRMDQLMGLRAELGCAVLPLLTTEPALLQLARGLGSRPAVLRR